MKHYRTFALCAIIMSLLGMTCLSFADVATVQDQDVQYKYRLPVTGLPSALKPLSRDTLSTDLSAGVTQGVDTNPLLDSTHKADCYIEETVDMHFRQRLPENGFCPTDVRFGVNALNVNYYRITDVNIFDGRADAGLDFKIYKDLTLSFGYLFEPLWFPHSSSGTYLANETNFSFKQTLTKWLYQRGTYRFIYRNYTSRKIMLGNGNLGSPLRRDARNVFRHELGVYIGDKVKVKGINEFYINQSNYEYLDYYDYTAYRTGGSLIAILMPRLYGTASFYYQRKRYDSRTLSDNDQSTQRDNLYTVTGSLIHDITKDLSLFVSYSHSENHTNEPLEEYVDTLYSAGLSYSF